MKLSISHTWPPFADEPIKYTHGMDKPITRCMAGVMKDAVQNTIKEGGLHYSEYQDATLEEANRILNLNGSK